jgi:hypothetical protein
VRYSDIAAAAVGELENAGCSKALSTQTRSYPDCVKRGTTC